MYKSCIKRLLDLIIAILGLPFFLIAFIIFAPIIKLTDKGPVFYNADRIGKNGKLFKMYKFRSMYVNAPDIRLADGSTYNGEDDPRVTKVGKIFLTVRPGLTGYSQAYFRNSADGYQKMMNDAYYAQHVSFVFDVKIFFKTIATVVGHSNTYKDLSTEQEAVKQANTLYK